MTTLAILIRAACAALLISAAPVTAQSAFSPAIKVGDTTITQYQLDERTRFLALLRAPGDPRDLARDQLINEALQRAAARDAGLEPSPEEITAGLEEFAARANLTAEEFFTALAQNGVDGGTYRDFITAGVAWRTYVREVLGEEARDIPESLVRRTLARTGTEGGLRVLLSEILLPAQDPQTRAASLVRAREISALDGEAAFAAAARTFSTAPTSVRGGEVNWRAIDQLPEEIRGTVSALSPGQISAPIDLGQAIAVFLLRDEETVAAGTPDTLLVDYALFTAGSATDAAAVAARVDVCDDLYGVARGLPPERLVRETVPVSQLPGDVRTELSRLDENEISTAITRGGTVAVLMLCERTAGLESTVDFEIIGTRLLNQRLGNLAAHRLAEIRARTRVVDLTN